MTAPLGYDQFEEQDREKAVMAAWRLQHPSRRSVKIHRTMHVIEGDFKRIPHSLRHTLLRPAFWLGLTMGFPLEHMLWEHLWPFYLFTEWAGLCATGVHGCLG